MKRSLSPISTRKLFALTLFLALSTTGCLRPYDTPEFATIEPSKTAF